MVEVTSYSEEPLFLVNTTPKSLSLSDLPETTHSFDVQQKELKISPLKPLPQNGQRTYGRPIAIQIVAEPGTQPEQGQIILAQLETNPPRTDGYPGTGRWIAISTATDNNAIEQIETSTDHSHATIGRRESGDTTDQKYTLTSLHSGRLAAESATMSRTHLEVRAVQRDTTMMTEVTRRANNDIWIAETPVYSGVNGNSVSVQEGQLVYLPNRNTTDGTRTTHIKVGDRTLSLRHFGKRCEVYHPGSGSPIVVFGTDQPQLMLKNADNSHVGRIIAVEGGFILQNCGNPNANSDTPATIEVFTKISHPDTES